MIVLMQDRGARVKNSFIIDATKKMEGQLPKKIMICMFLFSGGIENIYTTVTLKY